MATEYFSHCWAVFEGGGVRGSAHAGAYAAARKQGVIFGRVAGTSAGSIVAALVAAGAEPDFIKHELQAMTMKSMLGALNQKETIFAERPLGIRMVRPFVTKKYQELATSVLESGLHSSEPIQAWMEKTLRKALGNSFPVTKKGNVTFEDLKIPLHVVATDITAARAKVWSRERTPEASVAHAVRCSCSIPFFFQAVSSGGSVYVDGGVVSNLPSFVFSGLEGTEARSVLSRILAFRLIEDVSERSRRPANFNDFTRHLADAMISGATEIQHMLQRNVYQVNIDTGKVRSTDFEGMTDDKKRDLYKAGMDTVNSFLENELLYVRDFHAGRDYRGYDERLFVLIKGLKSCRKVFWAVDSSTYWINFAFPMLLAAARRGISINIITSNKPVKGEEHTRGLLQSLGAQIVAVDESEIPFSGFVFDPDDEAASAALGDIGGAVNNDDEYRDGLTKSYKYSSDPAVLKGVREAIKRLSAPKVIEGGFNYPYVDCPTDELFDRLKRVPQYAEAKFSLRIVELSDEILVLQRSVKEFKLLQIRQHVEDMEKAGCRLFEPKKVQFADGGFSIVTPPVLEKIGDALVVIEGNTRVFYCRQTGRKNICAVVVEGVRGELPTVPRSITAMRLTSSTVTLSENSGPIDHSLFRPIEKEVHASTATLWLSK